MFVLTSYCSQLVENRTNTTYVFEKFSYQFSTWVGIYSKTLYKFLNMDFARIGPISYRLIIVLVIYLNDESYK